MALTPVANAANQVANNEEIMAAHAQLNTLVTKEVEKTGEAFQVMNNQVKENLSALAEENGQLKKRVTLLEGELRQEKTLREEERRNTLEVIEELQKEVQALKNNQAATNANLQHLTGIVGTANVTADNRWTMIKDIHPHLKFCETGEGCLIQ